MTRLVKCQDCGRTLGKHQLTLCLPCICKRLEVEGLLPKRVLVSEVWTVRVSELWYAGNRTWGVRRERVNCDRGMAHYIAKRDGGVVVRVRTYQVEVKR